jgi:hypothetical protein
MEYRFIYFFLQFFKKFNYLPPSLRFKVFRYNNFNFWNYVMGSFSKPGRFLTFSSVISKVYLTTWLLFRVGFDRSEPHEALIPHNLIYLNFWKHLRRFFTSFKFVFFFFFQKLNKRIYKFSNYKLSRFNMKLFYLPPYRRMRKFITFASKTLLYSEGRDFQQRLQYFMYNFMFDKLNLFFIRYTLITQVKVFKKHRNTLFLHSSLK